MLGIAHSPVPGATMTIEYVPGDISLRDLHADDIAAICASYPPGNNPGSCDPTPRHGFQEACGEPADGDEGCSCRMAPASGRPAALALVGLALFGVRRRKRHR